MRPHPFSKFSTSGFLRGIESIELENRFARPWKSIEFVQNVHKVLKKCGNYKFNHLFIQFLFFTTDDSFADVFSLCSMNKILEKRKLNDGTKSFLI